MAEEKLNNFIINYLTEEQYAAALEAGTINDNDFYCTSNDLENNEQNNTGVETVLIKLFDTDEEEYDKMFSSVEAYDDEANGFNARLIKNVIYENNNYGDYEYYQAIGSSGEFDESNTLLAVTIHYARVHSNKLRGFSKRAYLDNGVKTIEEINEWDFFLRAPIDSLTSPSTEESLSANQGRILNEKIEENKVIYGNWTPEFQYYGTFDATANDNFDWATIGSTPNCTYAVQKGQYVIENVVSEDGSLPARRKVTLTFHVEAEFTAPSFGSRGVSVAMFLVTPFAPAIGTNQQVFVGTCAAIGSAYSSTPEKLRIWTASPDYFSFSEDGTTVSTKGHIYCRYDNFIITCSDMTTGDIVLLGSIEYFID